MYSSDRMKTFIRIFKDYDKNIVFRNCQMHFLIFIEKKGNPLFFFHHSVELPAKNQPL